MNKKKMIIVSLVLVCIISFGIIIGIVLSSRNDDEEPLGYEYNTTFATEVKKRVGGASYLPDSKELAEKNANSASSDGKNDSENKLSEKDYENIIDEFGTFDCTDGNLKSIYDIKTEIYYAVSTVPMFDRWFKMPVVAKWETESDRYNDFFYRFEYDKDTKKISVKRLSRGYQTSVYSSEEDKILGSYTDLVFPDSLEVTPYKESNVYEYEYMQADYYYNSYGKEIIEMNLVNFVKVGDNYYPVQSQYIKMAENSSLTKVQNLFSKKLTAYTQKVENEIISSPYDIDTSRDGGVMRKMFEMNYGSNSGVDIIKIEQNYSTDYYSDIVSTNVGLLVDGEVSMYYSMAFDHYVKESADTLTLDDLFICDEDATKDEIVEKILSSNYTACDKMGELKSTSSTVCDRCYLGGLDSDRLVYKCEDNISSSVITRVNEAIVCEGHGLETAHKLFETKFLNLAIILFGTSKDMGKYYESEYERYSALGEQAPFDVKYPYFETLESCFEKTAVDFLQNSTIVYKISDIFNEIMGSFAPLEVSDITTGNLTGLVSVMDISQNVTIDGSIISYKVSATLDTNILLVVKENYSLSLVLYSEDSNKVFVISNQTKEYNGEKVNYSFEGKYDLREFTLSEADFNNSETSYRLGVAVTKKSKEGNTLMCSRLYTSKLYSDFEGLKIEVDHEEFPKTLEFYLNSDNQLVLNIKNKQAEEETAK